MDWSMLKAVPAYGVGLCVFICVPLVHSYDMDFSIQLDHTYVLHVSLPTRVSRSATRLDLSRRSRGASLIKKRLARAINVHLS